MYSKPLKVSGITLTTNNDKKSVMNTQRVKHTSYTPTFRDLLEDLMLEQQEQM